MTYLHKTRWQKIYEWILTVVLVTIGVAILVFGPVLFQMWMAGDFN